MNVYQPLDILVPYATNLVHEQEYFNDLSQQSPVAPSKYNPDYFPAI